MSIIEAKDLSKKYGTGATEVNALAELVLSVEKGEFVSVMGASGSGKSTLLHLLGGLDKPTQGKITLEGEDITGLSDKRVTVLRRNKIGFVFQFYNLLPTLNAEENIALPFLVGGKKPSQFQKRVEEMLKLVGLTQRRHHKPDELSGGEQQRVAIARALAPEPAIVLADEPTGNLDSRTGQDILKLLRKSCDELEQTIVMVTHDPQAAAYADRVVFLKDGSIVNEVKLGEKIDAAPIIARLKELRI